MTRCIVYCVAIFVTVLLLTYYTQAKIAALQAYAQLPTLNFKPNIPSTTGNAATISFQTTNIVHGNNKNILIQEEPIIRKAVLGNINDAIFIAKGGVKNNVSVSVSAKIINQIANNRISTTQGLDFTKKLVATELANAINTITGNITASTSNSQVVVDNQATCSGIASPTNAACALTINIHG